MKDDLLHLIGHMRWADERALQSLHETPEDQGLRILTHVLATEQICLDRKEARDPWPQDFWPDLSIHECSSVFPGIHDRYERFITARTEEDLQEEVWYRTSGDDGHRTVLRKMLTHVVLHGEHHRGQIAHIVQRAGGRPAATDYIVYARYLKSDGLKKKPPDESTLLALGMSWTCPSSQRPYAAVPFEPFTHTAPQGFWLPPRRAPELAGKPLQWVPWTRLGFPKFGDSHYSVASGVA